MQTVSDIEIVECIKNAGVFEGEASETARKLAVAIKSLYRQSFPSVRRMCLRRGLDGEDAQDIFQEAIIKFCERVRSDHFTPTTAKLSSFIFMIAGSLTTDMLRRRDKFVNFNMLTDIDEFSFENFLMDENKIDEEERMTMVLRAFKKLNPRCQEVLRYQFSSRYSSTEIAKIMGYTDMSVRVVTSRCMQQLRNLL